MPLPTVAAVLGFAITAAPPPTAATAPEVVEIIPASGEATVDPALPELRVTFDRDMSRGGYSWTGGGESFPEVTGRPHWIDARTCVLPVRLVPDRTYRVGINGGRARNFRSAEGVPVVPVPVIFRTSGDEPLPVLGPDETGTMIAALRNAIDTRYSYRDRLGLDWDERFAEHGPAMEAASNPIAFAIAAHALLDATADPHLSLRVEGASLSPATPRALSNDAGRGLETLVPGLRRANRAVMFGRFDDGIGYIRIETWSRGAEDEIRAALRTLEKMTPAPGLVIDVRANGGGDELLAREFAGRFVEAPVVYAKHDSCDGEGGFTPIRTRVLRPNRDGPTYRGPVAVLMGGRNMSSCEAFLLMMRQVERATLVGARSYGSSGNPKRVDLGHGVTVTLPSWRTMEVDGTIFEGLGIAPDVAVATTPADFADGDPVLLRALAVLRGTAPATELGTDTWPEDVDRPWIGPGFWANRYQDWQLADGRVECTEGRDRFPLRTLALLTRAADAPGPYELSVVTGPIDAPAPGADTPAGRGFAGFLLGAGGPHVDHRITALVHHRPAEDGGLLAVVDHAGRVAVYDNGRHRATGGLWSIGGPLDDDELPLLASAPPDRGARLARGGPIELRVAVRRDSGTFTLDVEARDTATDAVLSTVTLPGLAGDRIDGGIALVSHLGPAGSRRGHWFRELRTAGAAVVAHGDRAFGPVLAVQYTVGRHGLAVTAQGPPLGTEATTGASLEIARTPGAWETVARTTINADASTWHFRLPGWRADTDVPYRVRTEVDDRAYEGTIRAEPVAQDEYVIGSLNCHKIYTGGLRWNERGIWFPHAEVVAALRVHDPDLLFFAGDQIYEGDLDPAQMRPADAAILDYLYKWSRWCWAFGAVTRDRPTVTIPDDHDVYHGNFWGAGGRRAVARDGLTAQDSGGYRMSPRFVNAVHRTQTGHLPPPADPAPIGDGYSTYYTRLDHAGVSYAILADRQFKSAPAVAVPEGAVVNGWFRNPDFDPATQADVPGAVLLGPEQLAMLRAWADDGSGDAWMKVALSQTPFTNVATLPAEAKSGSVLPSLPTPAPGAIPDDHRLAADADSNGWPQSGRRRAVLELQRARAIHLCGDQHLGSLVEYGLDAWRDAGYAFCSPAIANTWPRRWFPPEPGRNRAPGAPPYTGDFLDGFGNRMTVHAVANPVVTGREPANLYDRMPGYGIVRLQRATGRITFECWPRGVDPALPGAGQYAGWPVTIDRSENAGTR